MDKIPLLGLGTYPLAGETAVEAVSMALALGIRHIDTAQMYGNEAEVGRALAQSLIPLREIFVVTKVDPGNLAAARFKPSVLRSVEALGGPPDLLLIHWPPPDHEVDEVIDRLLEVHEQGLTRQIGVSNFPVKLMRQAQARSGGLLVCNQVEFHPLLDQRKLLAAAQGCKMQLTAYRPLGRGTVLQHAVIQAIAARLDRPASEIVLRWIIQQGVAAIPMTRDRGHLLSNLKALTFTLAEQDMAAISALGSSAGRGISPASMAGRWDS